MTTLAAPTASPAGVTGREARRRWRLEPGWPLMVLFAGIPLWWALGLFQIAFFVMAIPMLVHLLRQRRVLVPDGFGLWLLLLVWVLGGVLVLQVDAPSAVPGASMARYLTFAFRFGWYICGTVALLYVVNTARSIRTERVAYAVGWMFLSLLAGGLAAAVVPALEFRTPLEMLLPRSLASNEFVSSLVHAQVAQLQDFLGYVEPRASAPFPYANQWGISLAATAPHFIVGWWAKGGIHRRLVPFVAAIAVIPIVSSLNRGMWGAFILMSLYALARSKLYRRPALLGAIIGSLTVAATAIWISPLGSLIVARLNTPHSDQGRTNLGTLTIESTLAGSPIMGFGTTREVQGNFNSIAAGSTAACPACSPPPLGTQGNLWELMFGVGFVGLLLYLAFMAVQLIRYGRLGTPLAIAAQCTLLAVLVTSPVYNLVHPVLVVVLIALGILVRESRQAPEREFADMVRPLRRGIPVVLLVALLGASVGGAVQLNRGTSAQATQRVLVPQVDLLGTPGARPLTLDSESLIAQSRSVLEAATAGTDITPEDLAERITISAVANTHILVIKVAAATPAAAREQAIDVSQAYLDVRGQMAEEARDVLRSQYDSELQQFATAISIAEAGLATSGPSNRELMATLVSLQQQSQTVATSISELEGDLDVGRLLAEPRATTPTDPWVVAISSGMMLGLMLGLSLAWVLDGRLPWLHANGRTPSRLPIVDLAPTAAGRIEEGAIGRAAQVVDIYSPLAGVLSDKSHGAAHALAARLDSHLLGTDSRRGRRLLLVAARTSSAGNLERLRRNAEAAGLNPVGVILVDI